MGALRTGSHNILHGMRVLGGAHEPDDSALWDSVAALDVDVLGLQEVDHGQPRSGMAEQTAVAAGALGAEHWSFVPTLVGTPGPGGRFRASTAAEITAARSGPPAQPLYGVGLISRVPVREWRHLVMPATRIRLPLLVPGDPRPRLLRVPDEPRGAIAAVLDLPTPVTVATVHLSFVPLVNVRQLRRVKAWLADLPRPLILLGDFNLPGRLPGRVTGWHEAPLGPTYPVFSPRIRFDHILSDGIRAASTQVHPLPVSDHCAVTASFWL
ncbi:MAG TPA: endonuclease/exonuclease/phosphatase family protein [Actinomycetota bacterium]|nr:endonuclease/exonuclease/phosphatase family protein [Actinomycetota bacterium]